ncbi:MAG: GAF domain-containing protein [Chloroflexi bacterium]|jgi:two-component system NtrC family sensor kinase|nr:GAF domain-containing protein [Chloroflexota bacterium]
MTIANQTGLEENRLSEIETLDELLAGAVTLHQALQSGLAFILNLVGRDGGAICQCSPDETGAPRWISQGLPDAWRQELNDPESGLFQAVSQAFHTRRPAPADAGSHLAGIFPVSSRADIQAVLIVYGEALPAGATQTVQRLLRPLARAILTFQTHLPGNNRSNDLAALKIIADAQNSDLNINDIQLWILKGIKEIFEGEAVVLVLLDVDNRDIVIKKSLLNQQDWLAQVSLKLGSSLVGECIHTGQPQVVGDLAHHPLFNHEIDGVADLPPQNLLLSPLTTNGETLGAVGVLNRPSNALGVYELGLLKSMSVSLANSIFTKHLIQQLKVANADLEASRWEVLNSRNTLRTLFDSIPSSIYIIDQQYTLVAINMSRAERAGSKPNQLVGKKCYEKLYQRNSPCPGCRVAETLASGHTTSRTDRQWINNETLVEWDISSFAIFDNTNQPVQVILLEQDVTEKRRLEANLIQSEKLAAVGQLAAGVAHEINNPLSAIIANAQILRRDLPPYDVDLQESVKLIELAGIRASQVVRNLLGFARKENYNFENIDLNDTITSAVSLLQHEFVSRAISLNLELGKDLPRIYASKDHLQGVWINLILNAIDATEEGKGEITVNSRFQLNEYRVVISDNGKGIPPDRVSRIFEPFYTTKAPGRGTGLGLSVCHRIIKQHGGYIQVESHVGVGTKFVTVLPAAAQVTTSSKPPRGA